MVFIVQLPLPTHINEQKIVQAINPEKDVDGFHPVNVGKMVQNLTYILTCNTIWNFDITHKKWN
jgi:methylenetetrahydrofolate dehydrogenase (NADP+)/methenyltetrahydrofolate cyclohydrolase